MHNYNSNCEFENCSIKLQSLDLWKQFQKLPTEMVITKIGRRMFPRIRVQISGLNPDEHYCVFMEIKPAAQCRYRYSATTGWTPAGGEEAHNAQRLYVHPESPATGRHWMSQVVSFDKLKLTNNPAPPDGQVVLNSMHKYEPQIIIVKSTDTRFCMFAPSITKVFTEAAFITVTAYQNNKCKHLKIYNNPFAKGFREDGRSKCKRRLLNRQDEPNEEQRVALPACRSENEASISPVSSLEIDVCRLSVTPLSEANSTYSSPPSRESAHYNHRNGYVSDYNTHLRTPARCTNSICTCLICTRDMSMALENPYYSPYAPMYSAMPSSFSPYLCYQPGSYNEPALWPQHVLRPTPLRYNSMSLAAFPEMEETGQQSRFTDFSICSILDIPSRENPSPSDC